MGSPAAWRQHRKLARLQEEDVRGVPAKMRLPAVISSRGARAELRTPAALGLSFRRDDPGDGPQGDIGMNEHGSSLYGEASGLLTISSSPTDLVFRLLPSA